MMTLPMTLRKPQLLQTSYFGTFCGLFLIWGMDEARYFKFESVFYEPDALLVTQDQTNSVKA